MNINGTVSGALSPVGTVSGSVEMAGAQVETISATDDGSGNVTLYGAINAVDNEGNISL